MGLSLGRHTSGSTPNHGNHFFAVESTLAGKRFTFSEGPVNPILQLQGGLAMEPPGKLHRPPAWDRPD